MSEIKETKIHPNFIQLRTNKITGLFWDHYVYIDIPGYMIDEVFTETDHFFPVKFIKGDLKHPESPYIFCFLKCKPKYSEALTKYIFPALHKKIMRKYGDEYLQFCADCANHLINNYEKIDKDGDPSEIFSRLDA